MLYFGTPLRGVLPAGKFKKINIIPVLSSHREGHLSFGRIYASLVNERTMAYYLKPVMIMVYTP